MATVLPTDASTHNLLRSARDASKNMESGIYTHDVDSTRPSDAQVTQSFPRGGLTSRSARDELMKEKMEFMDKDTGMSPFGQVMATDADFKALLKKRETEAAANFDAWVGKNFHVNDVTVRRWLQETYPNYYKVREREMIDRAKRALQVKLLELRGPKTQKDLILLWGLQTGQIKLDRDWDRVGPSTFENDYSEQDEQERFAKGLFNPLRYLSDDEREKNRDQSVNPFFPQDSTSAGGGQAIRPFYGKAVPDAGRFPAFLQGII